MNITKTINHDKQLFLLILTFTFTIFVFTSDGHRYTFDEDLAQQQSFRIATMEPDPRYVQGESRIFFEYPWLFPTEHGHQRAICQNAILCSYADVGHSLTQTPFLFINYNFHLISDDLKWTSEDFDDPHYVWWRNSISSDFTFLELVYGPFFSSMSIGIFFLICRTFDFSRNTAVILSFLFGMSTILWAYSQTSLNVIPALFFVLLGYYFFRRYLNTKSHVSLILCSSIFGFEFLVRPDAVLFIIPIFIFILFSLWKEDEKIKKFFIFIIPPFVAYGFYVLLGYVRVGPLPLGSVASPTNLTFVSESIPVFQNAFGLFFSPGAGLFIFAPILITAFFSFPDFFRKYRSECILYLSFIAFFVFIYSNSGSWHGFNGWGARYLLLIVPFFLFPLGVSLEKSKTKILSILIIILGSLGFFFNLVYVIQDVSWFVWGVLGREETGGLYSLGRDASGLVFPLWINPIVIWTFEYSQLTQTILLSITNLQLDILMFKILGPALFSIIFTSLLLLFGTSLVKILKTSSNLNK